jgi:hypothetical protein
MWRTRICYNGIDVTACWGFHEVKGYTLHLSTEQAALCVSACRWEDGQVSIMHTIDL